MEQNDLLSNDILINNTSQANLLVTAKWGRFLSIVGFVFCGLMILGGISLQVFMSTQSLYRYPVEFTKYIGIFYLLLAVILFFPCLYLFKFSKKMMEALRTSQQESLDNAFMNLKSVFRFYGIFTIVMLAIYAMAIIGGVATTLLR